ncbi:MAG: cobalamin B12-binding domain-containing protein [Candidatus Omnitrophica bacterium]|nr:cobalamin B12-binding domain-containing protein [Candidatus Omnitrophota bacterium]
MSQAKLDAVLINPGGRSRIYQALGLALTAIEPPVWAGLMATFVRRRGHSVTIIDAEAEELTPEEVAARIEALSPLLAAVVVYGHQPSASTQNMTGASAICMAIKQRTPTQHVLLVGGHVAALPERTLREEAVDFVCSGEGPVTLLELLEALKANGCGDLSKVRGLWYRKDGEIQWNPAAPLVKDLDGEMPGMAWDLLPMEKYRAHNWHALDGLQRQPYASLYTTIGCPFHCQFCCIQAPFKSGEKELGYKASTNSYRFWSPQTVIAQLDTLVTRYGVRNIKIADEMFVLHPKHVLGICEAIIERGYDLNIWAYARVDTVRDDMVDKLKRAGFNWLAFGIEAANERVRNDGNYIFGLPEDDLQTMQETLDLALELNCEFANLYSTMAYPGSALYELALKEGWPLPERWSGYSQHAVDTLPLPTKHISGAEVLRFRDHAFQIYFSSPRYLEMVERKFGPETVAHVKEMASHKLERQYAEESRT